MMLDTAIVGGGLCGLALARQLLDRAQGFAVFEARRRLGGRVLSVPAAGSGTRVDLGPTWFWPRSQPLMARLVEALGLESFAQHDSGTVLALDDPDKPAAVVPSSGVHDGARRLTGGMTSLIEALAGPLPADSLYLDHPLGAVLRRDGHVELHFLRGDELIVVFARRVVLAVPPRLLAQQVRFEPPLDAELHAALLATPTWMAAQSRAVVLYADAAWRAAGQSGNAFVRHAQAVLREVFDTCDRTGNVAALGGFLALTPTLRRSFAAGLPMLIGNQMTQLFGARLQERGQVFQDWANEPFTCSRLDLTDADGQAGNGPAPRGHCDPVLRQPLWEHRLLFGGSETAAHDAGHLEGALEAAGRLLLQLGTLAPAQEHAASPDATPMRAPLRAGRPALPAAASTNAASLAQFRLWVRAQQQPAFEGYRRRINRSLATQEREQLAQRAMLATMEEVFDDALARLETLPFDTGGVPVERGRSALTPHVQAAFQGFIQNLLDEVMAFNRASCALSNFPDEHHLPKDYEQTILRDIAAAWRDFSLSANSFLLSGKAAMTPRPGPIDLPRGVAP
jgi:monoamine oxidase